MGRYTGPRTKISRRFGEPVFGPDKVLERRPNPPGQHGANKRRKKMSEYGVQLREKQKVKAIYGMREKQFRLFFERAKAKQGVTGDIMLALCECRLDNIVYRLGLAPSRRAARQFVLHGHVLVNDRKAAVPSMVVKVGDFVSVKDSAKSKDAANRSVEAATGAQLPVWIQFDRANLRAEVLAVPTREQIAPIVDEQAIVELYSR